MADDFAQFGGTELPEPAPQKKQQPVDSGDPFAEFGGVQHPAPTAKPSTEPDPFAQFGGESEESPIDKEIRTRSMFNRPAVVPERITDEEINQIATKYGTDPASLRSALPFLGGLPQNVSASDVLKGTAGIASQAAMGIPQKLYKLYEGRSNPKLESALDELQELASGRKSYAQEALELGVPVAGAAGAVGKGLGAAARTGALVGAAGGFGGSSKGRELGGIATGAALGGALGVGGEKLSQYLSSKFSKAEQKLLSKEPEIVADIQKIGDDQVAARANSEAVMEKSVQNNLPPEYTPDDYRLIAKEQIPAEELQKRIAAGVPEEQVGREVAEKRYIDFAKHVSEEPVRTVEDAQQALQKEMRQGPDYLAQKYRDFAKGELTDQYIREHGLYDTDRMGRLGQIGLKSADAQFALRIVDHKFRTDAEDALTDLSTRGNLLTYVKGAFRKELQKIGDDAKKLGLTEDLQNGGRIYKALETGQFRGLSNQEKDMVVRFRDQFNRVLEFANDKAKESGVPTFRIPRIDNFVHQVTLSRPEIQARVTNELENAASLASNKLGREVTDISRLTIPEFQAIRQSPEVENLVQFINMGNPEKIEPRTGADLVAAVLDRTESKDGVARLEKMARGMMERTGAIPDFIREKDMFRVLDRYTHDLLSNLYQRQPLDRLRAIADRLDTARATPEADYIRRLVQDAQGIRPDSPASWMSGVKKELARKLDGQIVEAIGRGDRRTAFALNTVKEMADLPYWLSKQIYANVLGWNPHALLQNAASGFARTAPELGNKYGYQTYLKGLAYGVANWRTLSKHIRVSGIVPEEFNRQGERWLLQGLASSNPVHMSKQALEGIGKLGMAAYQASENLNRISIIGTARIMANDIVRGNKLAQESLTNFPVWLQRKVAAAGGDEVRIGQDLAKYLNATTAFNYNRPSLYEYGRTMGPIFSMFAKWPTAILGEAMADLRTKGMTAGTRRIAQRLGTPLLAFAAMDQLLSKEGIGPEDSDRTRKILGAGGLKKAAPATSLGQIASGGIFTPPVIDTIWNSILKPGAEIYSKGDIHDLSTITGPISRGIDRAAFTYSPGAGFIRFLGDDLPTYITGERPEGSTQTERVLETARRVLK